MSETPAEWAERRCDEIQALRRQADQAAADARTAPTPQEIRRAHAREIHAQAEINRRGGTR